ncbi:ATP-binding protein [Aeromicrobium sp. Root495]|uniref:ATP-binding protein n=1 Tax=Aeromicrobium sp. Root495 TaxID=1736550 RepID=UPI000AE1D9E8|nr:ATP-binding protein [Aeromicrobium sp. Root495]
MLPGLRTTHDWTTYVDPDHVRQVREDLSHWQGDSLEHLVLEVLAYALDEAVHGSTRAVHVRRHDDGSWSVQDDGRGTDTRLDARGVPVVKPVMATPDLRFFDAGSDEVLADGFRRSGMSVVTAASAWLVHENRRDDGAWRTRYESGLPVGDPESIEPDGTSGTLVRFLPDPSLVSLEGAGQVGALCRGAAAGHAVDLTIDDAAGS